MIANIEAATPGDELFDATVIVLCEYVEHHVKEEEREMFPEVRGSKKVDLLALGERMAARKEALLQAAGKTSAHTAKESLK